MLFKFSYYGGIIILTIKSRDGVYTISAPEDAKRGAFGLSPGEIEETKYDKVQDVYIEVIEGQEANFYNLTNAIAYDCFFRDCVGLRLLAKQLRCHIKAYDKKYEFIIPKCQCLDDYLICIAGQIKL